MMATMDASLPEGTQYARKVSLLLTDGETALDLSAMHFRFHTSQEDEESPNNCSIRVFNLSKETMRKVQKEYSRVVLQAGYENGPFGVIFDGTIKQFKIGKEADAVTTYLDILAADGDQAYNFGVINKSLSAGQPSSEQVKAAIDAMAQMGVTLGTNMVNGTGGVLPRGKVLFGLARGTIRAYVQSRGATWSIQNGKIQIIPLDGYLPGQVVVLTAKTGLIGRPEQTAEGIKIRALLNPNITVGGTVKVDNASINQTTAAPDVALPAGQSAYNKWAQIQFLADTSSDGLYRVYVAEYVGDTRGRDWYVDLIGLTIDPVTNTCKRFG